MNRVAAEASFAQLNYRKAIHYYTKALHLSRSKGDVALFFNFGFSLEQVGKIVEAADQYKIAALSEDTLGQLSAFRLGQIYIQLNQFNAAINAFQTVLESEFNAKLIPQSYFFMAKSWFQLGNFEEAIDKLDFLKVYPNDENMVEAAQLLADAYLYTSDYKAAIDHLEDTQLNNWALRKSYQEVTLKYAQILFNKKLYDQVEYWLSRSLKNSIDSKYQLIANLLMAECLSAQNEYDSSISYFNKVIKSGKVSKEQKINAYYGLGHAQYNLKQYEMAFKNFSLFMSLNTSKNHLYLNDAVLGTADCLFVLKRFDEAISLYRKSNGNSGQEYASYQIANIYYLKNELEELKKCLRILSKSIPAHFLLIMLYFSLAKFLLI